MLKNTYAEKDKVLLKEEEMFRTPLLPPPSVLTSRKFVDDEEEEETEVDDKPSTSSLFINFSGILKDASSSRPTIFVSATKNESSFTEAGCSVIEDMWLKLLDKEEKHQNAFDKFISTHLQEMINLELVYWDNAKKNLLLNKSIIRKCGFIIIYDLNFYKPTMYSITDLFYNKNLCVYMSNKIFKPDVNFFVNSYKLLKLKANPQFSQ